MKINLYIGSRKVKTLRIKKVENWDNIIKRDYKVTIINHRKIFGEFIVTTFLRPVAMLNDPNDKEVNLNCIVYGGANIE